MKAKIKSLPLSFSLSLLALVGICTSVYSNPVEEVPSEENSVILEDTENEIEATEDLSAEEMTEEEIETSEEMTEEEIETSEEVTDEETETYKEVTDESVIETESMETETTEEEF